METLDRCFENVCELDIIFHVDKVSASRRSDQAEYMSSLGYCCLINQCDFLTLY